MSEPLLELLVPYFQNVPERPPPSSEDPVAEAYLNRLTTLPLSSLNASEPQTLAQKSHSVLLSLQALSTRSHKAVISSADHLSSLRSTLPALAKSTADLRDAIPKLDEKAVGFSETYNKGAENAVLDRRRKALLLSRNVDRLADVLDLPTLLSTAISSSGASASSNATTSSSATVNYASALDLNAHIRRLHGLYPESHLISSVTLQAEEAMQAMATNLIASLKTQGVKLAAAMRTISWLRRVAPELDSPGAKPGSNREGSLGALFLVCRLANLMSMLGALEPLRELADQETARNKDAPKKKDSSTAWSGGQQTERYLKRYIEIFREQSFAIISMFRSIFPPATEHDLKSTFRSAAETNDPLQPLPSALSTFPLHLIDMLLETLKAYLPNVQDRSSRDSLLTQVLYCAGSLGRLGGDFGMILAFLEDEDDETSEEWVEVIKKHRVLAGRLELMVGAKDG
jgi:conserved oligomeric Golgi complex subunit 8